jgi:hypothetical protein
MWERGLEEVRKNEGFIKHFLWGYGELSLENDVRIGERCIYLVCDFNERWLKDLSFLYYIIIVLHVEGRIGYVIYVESFLN